MRSILVESLKRLYTKGEVNLDKINELKDKEVITHEDYVYIVFNKEVGD